MARDDHRRSAFGRRMRWFSAAMIAASGLATLASTGAHASQARESSSACAQAPQPGSTTLVMSIESRQRTVIVHVPTSSVPGERLALVLNLHGSGSTARAQEVFSGMDATADVQHFLVAYPQALIGAGSGFDWNVPGAATFGGSPVPKGSADDVTFLTKLVKVLEAKYCINPLDVFATGMSGGARMVSQLACDASGVFAAVAPVAGLRHPSPCPTTRPVPVIAFHGRADPVDPFLGNGQSYWTYSVPVAEEKWAKQDHCSLKPTVHDARGYALTTYSHCAQGALVELYAVSREGHEWPGGPPMPTPITSLLGPQSSAISANATMWDFFAAHPLN